MALDKSAMVRWAVQNCKRAVPMSGNPSVLKEYFDFSVISQSYDCTNFVSNAILAGGSPMSISASASQGWYFLSLSRRSHSWSGVASLYDFLISNRKRGPAGVAVDYEDLSDGSDKYGLGDIIQFFNSSVWRHTVVITGFRRLSWENRLEPLVTGRTAPGIYNLNQPQSTIYPGLARRIIRLTGYYD